MKPLNYLFYLSIILISACGGKKRSALPYYNTPDFMPVWLAPDELSKAHTIPAFQFTDQEGHAVSQATVKGKIYAANFFFTACGSICPRMIGNLEMVQKTFAADTNVLILSHSVTPDLDTIPALKEYAAKNRIRYKNWRLLTGSKDSIYNLARKQYFADENLGYYKGTNDFLHTENIVLIDQSGHIRGVYNGTLPLEIEKMIEHIRVLENEM